MHKNQVSKSGKNTKKFFKLNEKQEIFELYQSGKKIKEISKEFHTSDRHIRDIVKQMKPNMSKHFTKEEEEYLINLYNEGITKEWQLRNYFQNKLPYTIRNKIKTLLNKKIISERPKPVVVVPEKENNICFYDINTLDVEISLDDEFIDLKTAYETQ